MKNPEEDATQTVQEEEQAGDGFLPNSLGIVAMFKSVSGHPLPPPIGGVVSGRSFWDPQEGGLQPLTYQ